MDQDVAPLSIVVDLSRRGAPDRPETAVANKLEDPEYHRHSPGEFTPSATLSWADLQADLRAMQEATSPGELKRRLSQALRAFLKEMSFARNETAILEATGKRRVDVLFRFSGQELYALPWELLPVGGDTGPLLGSLPHCLVQYELPEAGGAPGAVPKRPVDLEEGGRILFATAGVPGLDTRHARALEEACKEGFHPFEPERDCVRDVSLASLGKALSERKPAVLHLLCHGARMASAFGVTLRKADGSGEEVVGPAELAEKIAQYKDTLRLVVLCVCQSGAAAPESILGSVAMELHRAGIQAVVASRLPFSKTGSVLFTEVLYRSLLVDLRCLQDAFLAARDRLLEDPQSIDGVALQLFARESEGSDLRPFVVRPYRGLLSFGERQRRFFFGREREIEEATGDIQSLLTPGSPRPRLFVVTGGSGRGKSSIVPAGIAPALAASWPGARVVTVRPSARIAALEKAISEEPSRDLLLVVDQLEEMFTALGDSPPPEEQRAGGKTTGERTAYFKALWQVATDARRKTLVIATLRVDHVAATGAIRLPDGRSLEDLLYEDCHRLFLAPMRRDALHRVVTLPARRVGLSFEPHLAEAILDDAGLEPGNLPLLEHVLDELWKRRAGRMLTWAAYRDELGGLEGALEKRANAVLDPMLPGDQLVARRVLVRLVATYGDATQGTRRVVRRSELADIEHGNPRQVDAVITTLTAERLLSVRGPEGEPGAASMPVQTGSLKEASAADSLIEIAHEALIRKWERLREWVVAQEIVDRDLKQFEPIARKKHALVQRDDLAILRKAVQEHGNVVSPEMHDLLARSERAVRRRRWRIALTAVAGATFTAGMTTLAIWAVGKKHEADEARVIAETARLEQEATARDARRQALIAGARALVSRGDASFAVEMLRLVDEPAKTRGFIEAANEVFERRPAWATFRGQMATPSPDGRWLATADAQMGTVYVHGTDKRGAPTVIRTGPVGITALAWSPDGARLGVTFQDGAVRFMDPRTGASSSLLPPARGLPDDVMAGEPKFSADGRYFTAVTGGHAWSWSDLDSPSPRAADMGPGATAAPGPDGRYILVLSMEGTVDLWTMDPDVPCETASFAPRPCRVKTLAAAAMTAGWGATSFRAQVVRGDDVTPGAFTVDSWTQGQWTAPRETIHLFDGGVADHRFYASVLPVGPRGWLFSSEEYATLIRADLRSLRLLPGGHPAAVSPDGTRVVLGGGQPLVVDVEPSSPRIALWAQSGGLTHVAFGPDGQWAVTSSALAGTSRMFRLAPGGSGVGLTHDLADPTTLRDEPWLSENRSVTGAARLTSSPRGGVTLVDLGQDGAYLWDLRRGTPALRLTGTEPRLDDEGARVVSVDRGAILVTSTSAAHEMKRIEPTGCDALDAAFAPPGSPTGSFVVTCSDGTIRSVSETAPAPGAESPILAQVECPPGLPPVLSDTGKSALYFCEEDETWMFSLGRGVVALPPMCPENAHWIFGPDGATAACFADDEAIFFVRGQGITVRRFLEPGTVIENLAISPNGKRGVLVTSDNAIHVLRLDDSGEQQVFSSEGQPVQSVSFDATGSLLATGSWDGVRLYTLDREEPPLSLAHGTLPMVRPFVSLAMDGSELVFLDGAGLIRRYSLSVAELGARLAEATIDCLPPEVRHAFAAEPPELARKRYLQCERDRGR